MNTIRDRLNEQDRVEIEMAKTRQTNIENALKQTEQGLKRLDAILDRMDTRIAALKRMLSHEDNT